MEIYTYDGVRKIYLTRNEFNDLITFHPNSSVPNNEGIFKLFNIDGQTKLIKAFYYTRRLDTIQNNINILITYKEILKKYLPMLVLPEDYIFIENNNDYQIGFTLKPIIGTNLQDILAEESYNYKKKILLIKNLGKFLEKFGSVPNFPYKIFIGDLHEGNIMITNNKTINLIDTTSLYIDTNFCEAQPSKYLEFNEEIKKEKYNTKYKMQSNGLIIPNKNTDIFCYTFIILNALASTDMAHLPLSVLNNYLDYLEYLKFNAYFLHSVTELFSTSDNQNPCEFLNNITNKQFKKAHYLEYKRKTGYDLYLNKSF